MPRRDGITGAYRVCLPGRRETTLPVQQIYLLEIAHRDAPAGYDAEHNKEEELEGAAGRARAFGFGKLK